MTIRGKHINIKTKPPEDFVIPCSYLEKTKAPHPLHKKSQVFVCILNGIPDNFQYQHILIE